MPFYALIVTVVAGSYLVGGIPFGYLAVRICRGIDIRTIGSGNVGATNVMRAAGNGLALVVLALDILKGLASVLVLGYLLGPRLSGAELSSSRITLLGLAAAAGAVAGHVFTPYLRFRGGKGVATGLGVVLALMPKAALVALAVFVVVVALTRYVSLGSMLAAVALVVAEILLLEKPFGPAERPLTIFCVFVALMIIQRHTGNIRRLLAGTENKFRFSSGAKGESDR